MDRPASPVLTPGAGGNSLGPWSNVRRALLNLPIRRKLMVSYLVFIAVPLVVFSSISYLAVARYYDDQVWFSAAQAFDQASTFLSSKVNALVKASDIVYFSGGVQTVLTRPRATIEDNPVQQSIDQSTLDPYLGSFRTADDVFRVTLLVPGWLTYSSQKIAFDNVDEFFQTPAGARVLASRDKVVWVPRESVPDENDLRRRVPVVSMYRKVRDYENLGVIVGVLRVSLLQSTLDAVVGKASTTRNGEVFLWSTQGTVVSPSAVSHAEPDRGWREAFARLGPPTGGWEPLVLGGKDYSVRRQELPNTDWVLVSVLPLSDIRYQSDRLRDLVIVLVLVIGALAYAAASRLTRSTTQRLSDLTDSMNRVRNHQAPRLLVSGARDEIGVLTDSFQALVDQIESLLQAQYRAGQELKSAELRALQAQINPHFLSNTLELINWQALNKGVPEIAELSRALARFYALSLNQGRDIVPLADELAHVRTYVEIQNRRFAQRLRLVVVAGRPVLGLAVNKLLLQPLVENAIHHGILEKGEAARGTIRVQARRDGDDLVITVRDNGVGMPDEVLGRLLTDGPTRDFHGYGVRNVHSRLQLGYGPAYGLAFESTPGVGTVVTVRLPARKQ